MALEIQVKRQLTGVPSTGLEVLTSNAQPKQSGELVEVMLELKSVLVASTASS